MTITNEELLWVTPLWRESVRRNLAAVPRRKDMTLVDCGGGRGGLADRLSGDVGLAINLDINASRLSSTKRAGKVCARAEAMPFADQSIDVIVSVSAIQYMDLEHALNEYWRVLKPNGVVMLHENGAYNPIIVIARLARRFMGLFDSRIKRYDSTIRNYLTVKTIQTDPRWIIARQDSAILLSALAYVTNRLRRDEEKKRFEYVALLSKFDNVLVNAMPHLKYLCWLNSFILMKPKHDGTKSDNPSSQGC